MSLHIEQSKFLLGTHKVPKEGTLVYCASYKSYKASAHFGLARISKVITVIKYIKVKEQESVAVTGSPHIFD